MLSLRKATVVKTFGRSACKASLLRSQLRSYHSEDYADPEVAELEAPTMKNRLLRQALAKVPSTGFTQHTLLETCRENGLSDAAISVFPGGPMDLVLAHLQTERLKLSQYKEDLTTLPSLESRVEFLVTKRLLANAPYASHLSSYMSLITNPTNLPASLEELHELSDEIWFLAGDESHDTTWYTKRAALSAMYASAEAFQSLDHSKDYSNTISFFKSRFEQYRNCTSTVGNIEEWLSFNAVATVNVAKSLLSRG